LNDAAVNSCELTVAYRTGDTVEAHALAGYLSTAGIDARVVGDFLDTAYAGLQLGSRAKVEVWIPGADRKAAEPLLAKWVAEHAPHEPAESVPVFRYSMLTVLLVITAAAAYMAAAAAGPHSAGGALVLFQLLLIGGAVLFVVRRVMRTPRRSVSAKQPAVPVDAERPRNS
jgi:Ni,Fe-hydrogenase I cytochrome b subunit